MGHLPPSHLHTAKGISGTRGKFRFRWYMVVILVLIVAGVGIAILRFSRASVIPPEELQTIQSGINISNPSINGVTVSYAPYNYTRQFSLPEAIRAQQDPAEYQRLMDLVIADLEKIYVKNHPGTTSQTPATSATTNSTSSTSTVSLSTQNDAQPVTASNSQSSSTSTTNTTNTTEATSAVRDLGSVSGMQSFVFNPSSNSSIKSVALVINNVMVGVIQKQPYTFVVDTSQFENGTYPLKTVLTTTDNSTQQASYTLTINNSSVNRWVYSLGTPWRFVFRSQ